MEGAQIYIPQYAKGKKLTNSRGVIKEIDRYQFSHLANTEKGSSGSPVFLKDSIKVIGIHKTGSKEVKENYGNFIYPVINKIKDFYEQQKKKKYQFYKRKRFAKNIRNSKSYYCKLDGEKCKCE
jgi:V8-like Glu-specific endopeptidase